MAIAIVQSSALTIRNGDSVAQATLSNVTAGNAIVVTAVAWTGGSTSNALKATDGATNLTGYNAFAPPDGSPAFVAWELAVAAGSHTINVTTTTANTGTFYDVMVHEVSGLGTTQPSVTTSNTTTGTTLALSGATPAQNDCIVFTVIADDGNSSSGTASATTPTGYTSLWSEMAGASNQVGAAAYQIQTTAAPVAPSWTALNAAGGAGWGAVAVAFAPVSSGTTITASESEAGSAADSSSASASTAPTSAAMVEAGSSADAQSVSVITAAVQSDAANAADTSTTGGNEAAGMAEPASAADASAQTSQTSAAQTEIASGADSPALSGGTSSVLAYASQADPNQTSTTSPLITAGITTPASGSTIIVNLLTESTSTAPVSNFSDSYGNAWTLVATNYYAGGTAANGSFPSYLLKCVNAKGGPNHTFQLVKNSVQDECTIYAVVLNGGDIGNWTADTTGTYAGTVTTSGANSTVLSFWSPNDTGAAGYTDNYHAPSGWVQMANNNNAYNSMSGADAYLSPVAAAGTAITATWTADNTGGGINPGQSMYMVEVTAPPGTLDSVTETESASVADASTSATQASTAQAETAHGSDASSSAAAVTAAESDSGTAADTPASSGLTAAAQPEPTTGTDTTASAASMTAAQTDGGTGADASTQSGLTTAWQPEAVTAADSVSTGNVAAAASSESGNATDTIATLILSISQIGESAAAAAVAAAHAYTTAAANEAANAADVTVAAQAGVSSVAESAPVTDASASIEQVTAASSESGAAADHPASGNVTPSSASEAGNATDTLSATLALLSSAQEIAAATDALTYAASTITDAAEAAHAQDLIANLAQLSQSITEAANAQDATAILSTLSEIAEWQYYAAQAARYFYAGTPFRSFYALCTSDMATQIPSAIDPSETKVLTLDATADLPSGVTLTGTPTVEVVVTRGTDPNPSAIVKASAINTTPVSVTNASGQVVTIAPGLCVQVEVSGCLDGCWYEIRVTCSTTDPKNVEVLKAILTCTAS